MFAIELIHALRGDQYDVGGFGRNADALRSPRAGRVEDIISCFPMRRTKSAPTCLKTVVIEPPAKGSNRQLLAGVIANSAMAATAIVVRKVGSPVSRVPRLYQCARQLKLPSILI